ncbi:LysM peptidoglycan-binding domain-containing protein [Candidatus Woesearchaeota archaeon]|nr:LysM peptidoglycan-binding domain-containing protein [Candidatus Woesearchaeota archaeon]
MGAKRISLNRNFVAASLAVLGLGGAIAAGYIYFSGQSSEQQTRPTQTAESAAGQKEQEKPALIRIEIPDGTCVEKEYRETWTIREGETAGDIALATLNGVENWLDTAHKILELNKADEKTLPVGQTLLIANGWQEPKLTVPEQPIILEPGQQVIIKPGLGGLLCGSSHFELAGEPLESGFDPKTGTFTWTPKLYDIGIRKLRLLAGDDDITTYGANSWKASKKNASVLSVEGGIELRVKVKPQEFVTDSNPPIRYRLINVNDEFTPALTINNRVAYVLNIGRTVNYQDVISAHQLAANPEIAFAITHQSVGGEILSSGTELTYALEHLRRFLETDGNPESMQPFFFGKDPRNVLRIDIGTDPNRRQFLVGAEGTYHLPLVTRIVQLSQNPETGATATTGN